jgi:hypothetical protein
MHSSREVRLKKYLQACETGGSIYGKKKPESDESTPDHKHAQQNNHMVAYSTFYKKQVNALFRLFRKE